MIAEAMMMPTLYFEIVASCSSMVSCKSWMTPLWSAISFWWCSNGLSTSLLIAGYQFAQAVIKGFELVFPKIQFRFPILVFEMKVFVVNDFFCFIHDGIVYCGTCSIHLTPKLCHVFRSQND